MGACVSKSQNASDPSDKPTKKNPPKTGAEEVVENSATKIDEKTGEKDHKIDEKTEENKNDNDDDKTVKTPTNQNEWYALAKAQLLASLKAGKIRPGDFVIWGRPFYFLSECLLETVDSSIHGEGLTTPIAYLTLPTQTKWMDSVTHASLIVEVGETIESIMVCEATWSGLCKHPMMDNFTADGLRGIRILRSNLFDLEKLSAEKKAQALQNLHDIVLAHCPNPPVAPSDRWTGSPYNKYQLLQYAHWGSKANLGKTPPDAVFEAMDTTIVNVATQYPGLFFLFSKPDPTSYFCSQAVGQVAWEARLKCRDIAEEGNEPFRLEFFNCYYSDVPKRIEEWEKKQLEQANGDGKPQMMAMKMDNSVVIEGDSKEHQILKFLQAWKALSVEKYPEEIKNLFQKIQNPEKTDDENGEKKCEDSTGPCDEGDLQCYLSGWKYHCIEDNGVVLCKVDDKPETKVEEKVEKAEEKVEKAEEKPEEKPEEKTEESELVAKPETGEETTEKTEKTEKDEAQLETTTSPDVEQAQVLTISNTEPVHTAAALTTQAVTDVEQDVKKFLSFAQYQLLQKLGFTNEGSLVDDVLNMLCQPVALAAHLSMRLDTITAVNKIRVRNGKNEISLDEMNAITAKNAAIVKEKKLRVDQASELIFGELEVNQMDVYNETIRSTVALNTNAPNDEWLDKTYCNIFGYIAPQDFFAKTGDVTTPHANVTQTFNFPAGY